MLKDANNANTALSGCCYYRLACVTQSDARQLPPIVLWRQSVQRTHRRLTTCKYINTLKTLEIRLSAVVSSMRVVLVHTTHTTAFKLLILPVTT